MGAVVARCGISNPASPEGSAASKHTTATEAMSFPPLMMRAVAEIDGAAQGTEFAPAQLVIEASADARFTAEAVSHLTR